MGLLLRSSPLSGSTEGEGVGVTVRDGRSGPVSSQYTIHMLHLLLQWNLSIKDALTTGHLSKEDTACVPAT